MVIAMPTILSPNGNPVRVGQVILRTPGLQGVANSYRQGSPDMRAAERTTDALEQALKNQNVQSQEIIEISAAREVPVSNIPTRSTTFDEPAIVADVPEPGDEFGQFVLYTDESGVTTWNFALDRNDQIDVTRGSGKRTYIIPRSVPPTEGTAESRSLIGVAGKKLLKVVVFPLVDPTLGKVGDYFVGKWERKNRQSRIRPFGPENYCVPDAPSLQAKDWIALANGRALLLVHGTFSSTHAAFSQMPKGYVDTLNQRYQGRVFAFDHFTLSEDPTANVEWFLEQMPKGITLDLDIICHSRGALVSRVLAERKVLSGRCSTRVRKVVFVGAPNGGTILTDTKYMGCFLDSYTNILNLFLDLLPETGVVETLDCVITVAKQLSLNTIKGLEGLQSMLPNGKFLKALNQGGKDDKEYFSISSDFEPRHNPGLKVYAANRLMDKVFHAGNDLVVPTASAYEKNGSGFFPIEDRYLFPRPDAVHHCNYFAQAVAREKILHWLS